MISSGIRIRSWDYLKWKHIIPLKDKSNNNVIAAKITVFDTKNNKEYFSFITPEAYYSLKGWINLYINFILKVIQMFFLKILTILNAKIIIY